MILWMTSVNNVIEKDTTDLNYAILGFLMFEESLCFIMCNNEYNNL